MSSDTPQSPQQIVIQNKTPVLGIVSTLIGLVGVPVMSFMLSPLALISGSRRMCKQVGSGKTAIVLAIIGRRSRRDPRRSVLVECSMTSGGLNA